MNWLKHDLCAAAATATAVEFVFVCGSFHSEFVVICVCKSVVCLLIFQIGYKLVTHTGY